MDEPTAGRMARLAAGWDRHQVPLALAAIVAGAAVGLLAPGLAPAMEHAIEPALLLLLTATFLGIPLVEVGRGLRDRRFLAAVLLANFVVVPAIAWALSRFVADDRALLLGVLLVLLAPCIDYVIVFAGLAGGAAARLLAATPLLMLGQILLLPAYLLAFAGPDAVSSIEPAPFVRALVLLVVVPLAIAAIVQLVARRHVAGRVVERVGAGALVPLMLLTLAVVVGSQIAGIGARLGELARLVPIYAGYVVVAVAAGVVVARIARLDVGGGRALAFSVATRNSLVVLPLALALPPALALAPLAVVTQTVGELVAMVLLVRLVPLLLPARSEPA